MTEPAGIYPKVFIAGAPRSGTSILLFAMKDVFGLPGYGESHVIPAFSQMVHTLFTYMKEFEALDSSVLDEILLKQVSLPNVREHLYQYIREFYRRQFPEGGWVDKTPSPPGVFALAMAEKVFPDARLMVAQRNGIEVVSSYVKKFGSPFESACEAWRSAMEGLTTIRPLCKNLLVVDQYDFFNATDRVASDIAAHVGFPEKAERFASFLRTQRVESSSIHDWSGRLRLADMPWSEQQKELFRAKCGETMEAAGYEI